MPEGRDNVVSDQDMFPIGNFLIAESTALRAEIRNAQQIEFQLFSYTLAVAGTAYSLGLGLGADIGPVLLMTYPILVVFLAARWAHSSALKHQIGRYLREQIEEPNLHGLGWESYLQRQVGLAIKKHRRSLGFLDTFATRALFSSTQIVAMVLAVYRSKQLTELLSAVVTQTAVTMTSLLPVMLFGADIGALVIAFLLVYSRRQLDT